MRSIRRAGLLTAVLAILAFCTYWSPGVARADRLHSFAVGDPRLWESAPLAGLLRAHCPTSCATFGVWLSVTSGPCRSRLSWHRR
jgi:hypothetical protein